MNTFHFDIGTLYPEDPGVQIGDRVILHDRGVEVCDFVVLNDAGNNPDECHTRCAVPSDGCCIRYNYNGKQPCIMSGCDGILKNIPELLEGL